VVDRAAADGEYRDEQRDREQRWPVLIERQTVVCDIGSVSCVARIMAGLT
jgi:hypothetical protein